MVGVSLAVTLRSDGDNAGTGSDDHQWDRMEVIPIERKRKRHDRRRHRLKRGAKAIAGVVAFATLSAAASSVLDVSPGDGWLANLFNEATREYRQLILLRGNREESEVLIPWLPPERGERDDEEAVVSISSKERTRRDRERRLREREERVRLQIEARARRERMAAAHTGAKLRADREKGRDNDSAKTNRVNNMN